MTIVANFRKIKNQIGPNVELIAVTKNRSISDIEQVIEAGATTIAENRIQEARDKFPQLPSSVQKHLIGHLQTNKTKFAVSLFDMIQSVDSLRLAEALNTEAQKINRVMPILIQVNVAADEKKSGFALEDIFCPIKAIGADFAHLKIKGLMTIVPHTDDPENARPHFRRLKELFDALTLTAFPNVDMEQLSMGMSNDYRVAVEEGATMVRIGSALFA